MNLIKILLILAPFLFVLSSETLAEVIRLKQTGYSEMSGDKESCYKKALMEAKVSGIKKVLKKIAKGANQSSINQALDNSEDAIRGVKVLKKKIMGDGRCRVKVRLKIDNIILASLVDESISEALEAKGSLSVGAVIRFLIDGKIADGNGGDTQEALAKLGQELQKYGIEVVNLDPLIDKYAKQQSRDYENVALAEGETAATPKKISSSEAIKQLINTIETVWDFAPDKLRKFDGVAVAQVYVRALGRDPQGPGYLAEVTTYVKIIQLGGGKKRGTEIGSAMIPGTIDGQTQERANTEAMILSIENSINVIAKALTN